jgi:hypothetical protein
MTMLLEMTGGQGKDSGSVIDAVESEHIEAAMAAGG